MKKSRLLCKGYMFERRGDQGRMKSTILLSPSTLTRLEEPYPMLVLCGPPGSGKGHFSRLLVEEFPSFFGLG